jgi:acid phosphatase type 7
MKLRSVAPLCALLPLALAPFVVAHCGNGMAPASPDGGVSTPSSDAAAIDGGALAYTPSGCAYSVTELASRGYTSIALDDVTQPASAASAAPARVRVGLRGNTDKKGTGYADPSTTAAFTWETAGQTSNARVRYATSAAALTSTASVQTGFVYTVPVSGITGLEPPTYFHEVDVCGLTPGTTYYYQVGGGAPGVEIWSAPQSFATVPAVGAGPITVGVFGDARDTPSIWTMVNQRMAGSGASILLISGDIVDVGVDEALFTQWLNAIWTADGDGGGTSFISLGQFIIVPVNGNHEAESSQFYANFAIPGTGPYANTYSSFDVGNTHFVMIDDQEIAEDVGSPESVAQLAWINSDLSVANADRANHPFIVAISHRGMFSTSYHAADNDVIQARASLAVLYDQYHVDLAMNGHDHEYERSKPLNAGNPATGTPAVVDGGTTYVINAGAGADPYAVASFAATYRQGNATALGSLSMEGIIGCYVLLTLEGTKLTLTAYGMTASGGSVAGDKVIDTFVLGQ